MGGVAAGHPGRAGPFRGPVLALCGELDDLAPPEVVEKALQKLGIDLRLAVVKGTGHLFEHRQREVGEIGRGLLRRDARWQGGRRVE